MTASLTHKASQNPQCYDLQMPCGSRCLIIFTCRCLISANQRLDGKRGGSRWGVTPTPSRLESDPFTEAHPGESATSAKRVGNPEKNIQWEALTLQPSNPLPTNTPRGRQWVGNTATVYGAERSFLLVSSSFHMIGTRSTSARERLCLCMNMT